MHHRGTNGRLTAAPAVDEPRITEVTPSDETADEPGVLLPTVTVMADLDGAMEEQTEE